LVSISHWTIIAGVKDAYYKMDLTQWADGKTVGALGCPEGSTPVSCTNSVKHSQDYNSILPSFEANYRINNNWSAYGQYGRGSIAPFSSVFDVTALRLPSPRRLPSPIPTRAAPWSS
jgi:iron complex outermembrane receptor protein